MPENLKIGQAVKLGWNVRKRTFGPGGDSEFQVVEAVGKDWVVFRDSLVNSE